MNPNYYAILTAEVRYCKTINANEKLLYAEITALTNKTGECWASNGYFAELYDVTPQAISKWIKNLESKGFLLIEYVYKQGTKEIEKRLIRINNGCLGINDGLGGYQHTIIGYQHTIKDNTKHNNTSINKERNKVALCDFDLSMFDSDEIQSIQTWIDFRTKEYKLKKTNQAIKIVINDLIKAKEDGHSIVNLVKYFIDNTTWQNINAKNIKLAMEKRKAESNGH